jgi:hypothetical protein
LAAFIANLGYSATANHLCHYELILPAVAVDAGLGELSRMGYLLTKEFGPRIRLSAVTTDMPLAADEPVDLGIQSFCAVCIKNVPRAVLLIRSPKMTIPGRSTARCVGS